MTDRFERAMVPLKAHEGGWSNHPDDPGGATMKGVTQRVYDEYRRLMGVQTQSVRGITDDEVFDIYRRQYWNTVRGNDLPDGLAYCVFDAAVNSGPGRAVRWLQTVLGVTVDGVIGHQTLGAAIKADPVTVINQYCDTRLAFMKRLKHWPTFKNGWSRRVKEVRERAISWVALGDFDAFPAVDAVEAKAEGSESALATVGDTLKSGPAQTVAGGAVSSVLAAATGDGPVSWAIAACLVMVALAGVYVLVKKVAS